MKLARKGEVTIRRGLRDQFGLHPRTGVTFEAGREGVLIKPAAAVRREQLRASMQRARGSATAGRSTREIMRLTRGED